MRRILENFGLDEIVPHAPSDRVHHFALNPLIGPRLLASILFVVFQLVFAWAEARIALIEAATAALAQASAREVVVYVLGTVCAVSAVGKDTALSLLAWYLFAPLCLSTLATVKRETGGRTMPLIVAGFLFGLAYAASFVTYRLALALGAS